MFNKLLMYNLLGFQVTAEPRQFYRETYFPAWQLDDILQAKATQGNYLKDNVI